LVEERVLYAHRSMVKYARRNGHIAP